MNNCKDKISNFCAGSRTSAQCADYETPTPIFSGLYEENCTNVEEVLTDVYKLIGGIKQEISLVELDNTCITFTEPKTPKSVIEQMYNKICELEAVIASNNTEILNLTARVSLIESSPCA